MAGTCKTSSQSEFERRVVYAGMYMDMLSESEGVLDILEIRLGGEIVGALFGNKGTPKLLWMGAVSPSQDGEWRLYTLSWSALQHIWDHPNFKKYRKPLSEVTCSVLSMHELPLELVGNQELRADVEPQFVAEVFAIISSIQIEQRRITPSDGDNARLYCSVGRDVIRLLREKRIDIREIGVFVGRTNEVPIRGETAKPNLFLGAKMRPLTLAELSHPNNPKYPAWRELITDLAITDILTHLFALFPFTPPQYFLVRDTVASSYSNHSQHQRYSSADMVLSIRDSLREAKEKSRDVEVLQTHLARALHYVDARMVLTNMSLFKFSFDVGRTFGMFCRIVAAKGFPEEGSRQEFFREPRLYEQVMVDWLYALLALHSRGRTVHLDLHARNFACNNFLKRCQYKRYSIPKPADGDGDGDGAWYNIWTEHPEGFPKRYTGALLDFSRSSMMNEPYLRAQVGDELGADLLSHQHHQLRRGVERLLGVFAEGSAEQIARVAHLPQLESSAISDAPGLLRAASALDVAYLARNALDASRPCNPSREYMKVLAELEVDALFLFEELLRDTPRGAEFSDFPDHSWPAARLLNKHFSHLTAKRIGVSEKRPPGKGDLLVYDMRNIRVGETARPTEFARIMRESWEEGVAQGAISADLPEQFRDDASATRFTAERARNIQTYAAISRSAKSSETSGSWILE